jgi:hypothetical protein
VFHRYLIASAKRERIRVHARIEKLDGERAVLHGAGLPDELIQALLPNRAIAFVIDIGAPVPPRLVPIDCDAKTHGFAIRPRGQRHGFSTVTEARAEF